ncbi:hypothetical protein [Methylocucumis oryzae]|uniref:Uncharacterized protein n=1 Tax=Methylocucumis oryzae TaxID=1632867 RepID=A0A0F3IMB0_9GAMM|nr:hypothetical protein [Methylocucumis oryzae]KJV07895.1 hypothetical protein VZ94_01585 [Methylocucumis oryzae]
MDHEIVSKVASHIAQRLRAVKPSAWVWLDSAPELLRLVCQQISELTGSIKIIVPPECMGIVESIALAGSNDQTLQQLCADVFRADYLLFAFSAT